VSLKFLVNVQTVLGLGLVGSVGLSLGLVVGLVGVMFRAYS